jgi:hypothetical protein
MWSGLLVGEYPHQANVFGDAFVEVVDTAAGRFRNQAVVGLEDDVAEVGGRSRECGYVFYFEATTAAA